MSLSVVITENTYKVYPAAALRGRGIDEGSKIDRYMLQQGNNNVLEADGSLHSSAHESIKRILHARA